MRLLLPAAPGARSLTLCLAAALASSAFAQSPDLGFAAAVYSKVDTDSPIAARAADFDGDGNLDLAVVGGQVHIRLGDGKGGFPRSETFKRGYVRGVGFISAHTDFSVADLNADKKLDIVTCHGWSPNGVDGVATWLGRGNGKFDFVQFSVVQNNRARNPASAVTTGDFDGDGVLDMASHRATRIRLFLGRGDASHVVHDQARTTSFAKPLVVGDFNGDGIADLAGLGTSAGLLVAGGVGDAGFAATKTLATAPYPTRLAVGDFDRDGRDDLVVIYFNNQKGGRMGLHLSRSPRGPWAFLGGGLRARATSTYSLGALPLLKGTGSFAAGTTASARLAHGRGGAAAIFLIGGRAVRLPLLGGTLVPAPDIALPVVLGGKGDFTLQALVPSGLARGGSLFGQMWVLDANGPQGFTSSNGLVVRFP